MLHRAFAHRASCKSKERASAARYRITNGHRDALEIRLRSGENCPSSHARFRPRNRARAARGLAEPQGRAETERKSQLVRFIPFRALGRRNGAVCRPPMEQTLARAPRGASSDFWRRSAACSRTQTSRAVEYAPGACDALGFWPTRPKARDPANRLFLSPIEAVNKESEGARMTWRDAERWRENLQTALRKHDSGQFERVWRFGLQESLWEYLGYESAEEFCRRDLELEMSELHGFLSTEDLPS